MDVNTWLLVATLILVFFSLFTRGNTVRLESVHRKLDLILKNLGIDPAEGYDRRILELVRSGQKIEAIRAYRDLTGCGLKEAKDYVDGL